MSLILSSIITATGGLLVGLGCTGELLWRQHQALARAQHAAEHDDTTGLPNRRALMAALNRALHHGAPCGIVLLDLDDFKVINDTFGHEAGNDVLTEVGQRLAAMEPPVRLAARPCGDEFVLLVDGGTEQVAAAAAAAWRAISRQRVQISHPEAQGGAPLRPGAHDVTHVAVYASVGYATASPGANARALLRRADKAMYEAKRTGISVKGPASAPFFLPHQGRLRDGPRT